MWYCWWKMPRVQRKFSLIRVLCTSFWHFDQIYNYKSRQSSSPVNYKSKLAQPVSMKNSNSPSILQSMWASSQDPMMQREDQWTQRSRWSTIESTGILHNLSAHFVSTMFYDQLQRLCFLGTKKAWWLYECTNIDTNTVTDISRRIAYLLEWLRWISHCVNFTYFFFWGIRKIWNTRTLCTGQDPCANICTMQALGTWTFTTFKGNAIAIQAS